MNPFHANTARQTAHQAGHESHVDICVMGGGAVASAAMLLARAQGLNAVHILPQTNAVSSHAPVAVPRTYAIAPRVQAGLTAVGVWDLLPASQVQVCTDMRVFWQHDSSIEINLEPIHLSAQQSGVPQLCNFVSEADLLAALNTAMVVTGRVKAQRFYAVDTPEQAPMLAHTAQGIRVSQAGYAPLTAKLCLIAEGAASRSAAQLDLAPTVYDYGHSAVVAVLHSDMPCNGTAWQWLGGKTLGSDVLALLPLPALPTLPNQARCAARYGLVWSQPTAQAQQWRSDTAEVHNALLAAVQNRCHAQRAQIGTLSLHSAVQQFPLTRCTAPQWVAKNVVLLGDTAHKIHPLAGQGLNLGFEDVFELFDVLAQREPWRSIGDTRLLQRYQRRRLAHAAPIDAIVHAIASRSRWHSTASATMQHALRMHNDFPTLGAWFKRQLVQNIVR